MNTQKYTSFAIYKIWKLNLNFQIEVAWSTFQTYRTAHACDHRFRSQNLSSPGLLAYALKTMRNDPKGDFVQKRN